MIQHETVQNFLKDLGLDENHSSPALESLALADSRFLRDLKLNVFAVLNGNNISKKDASLLALSIAVNEKNGTLIKAFTEKAKTESASDAEIAETHACVGVMVTNNVFYRFRHYVHGVEYYEKTPAGLRMSTMMNPVMGKELFELMSLVISSVNGCERCVTSHESSVKQHGATEARVYDAIRLGAVIRSLCVIA